MSNSWIQLPASSGSNTGGNATAAKQDIGNSFLQSIDLKIDDLATEANQVTEIALLTSIDIGVNGDTDITFSEVSSIASGVSTNVLTYTVVSPKKILRVSAAGTNIARYEVRINGVAIARKYTNFGDSPNVEFQFEKGVPIAIADIVTVNILHLRPYVGDFNASLMLGEN